MFYCSLQFYLSCSFLFDMLLHDLGSFGHRVSFGRLLLHESQVFIFLTEACQLVFIDYFNLFFRALLLVLLSFGLLMLMWWFNASCGDVHCRHLCLGCRLFWQLYGSSGFCRCWTWLCGCLWLGGCLGCFEDLTSRRLG
jgi:hypothetical protein